MKQLKRIGILCIIMCLGTFFNSSIPEDTKTPEITKLKFGTITVDGVLFEKDIVIDNGKVRQRKKGPSKPERDKYGHTPLTPHELIPWDCKVLVIGKGMSNRLPITKDFMKEVDKRNIKLIVLETPEAVEYFTKNYHSGMNAIFHITC